MVSRLLRPSAWGLATSVLLLMAGLAWVAIAGPPWAPALVAWFVVVAAVGIFLPGPANQLSLLRGYLALPCAALALEPRRALELAALLAAASLSDAADGMVARRFDRRTRLGGALDPLMDGLCFGAVAVALGLRGAFPIWLGLVVVARYAIPAAAGGLLLAAGRRPVLRHTPMGKVSTNVIGWTIGLVGGLPGVGVDPQGLVQVAEGLIPLSGLAAVANLAWSNRRAWPRSSFGPVAPPGSE